jgi:pantetheine-phosphate adenylyltransferase
MEGGTLNIKAVYPGTFDPVTNGHLDLIERGSALFDEITVAILTVPEKDALFSIDERVEMVREAVRAFNNVHVESFQRLLVDYVESIGAKVIVRGLRAVSDFEYELQMAMMNRRLKGSIETIFMMPNEAYSYLSSKLVKEVAQLGGKLSGLVPPHVEKRLQEKFRSKSK